MSRRPAGIDPNDPGVWLAAAHDDRVKDAGWPDILDEPDPTTDPLDGVDGGLTRRATVDHRPSLGRRALP
jgi:hypothetical protein